MPIIDPEPAYADVKDDHVLDDEIPVVVPLSDDEPIVTRRELWSYYRACSLSTCARAVVVDRSSRFNPQYTTTVIMCVL